MLLESLLAAIIALLAQTDPAPPDQEYPLDVCWVVREGAFLVSEDGSRTALKLGDMLDVGRVEQERLFAARARLGQIESEGWVERDDIANCRDAIGLLYPERSDKPRAGYSVHLALARTYHAIQLAGANTNVNPLKVEAQRHLEAAEKLAPANLEVMWARAMLAGDEPATERLRLVERVMAHAPHNAMVAFFRARAKQECNDREGAILDYQRALRLFTTGGKRYVHEKLAVGMVQERLVELRGVEERREDLGTEKAPVEIK